LIVEPLVQVPFLDFEAFMFFAVRQDELESHLLLRDVFFFVPPLYNQNKQQQ